MAGQLRAVLNRFVGQSAPVSLSTLAREMDLEPGVLRGMIDYWVRKGQLREVVSGGEGCATCGIKGACPFVVALPRYYELAEGDTPTSEAACPCKGGCH